ncbi:hypothetical protein CCC_01936 [Paramagnetospirillum magnetotacticum MS-1]|uniref:Uncharacterized protein n=2 Tax=Paramagnetospirillum magnetotacticum TaxID=188 RepID=A0A0C2YNJ8_PARME|nr:hypothetical protein CCC_01936 [Paramagnetospirillum magnetotacticum MS-1]
MSPTVGKTVAICVSAGIGWGVLSVLAVAALGSVYLCRKFAGELDEPVSDLEA